MGEQRIDKTKLDVLKELANMDGNAVASLSTMLMKKN